MVDYTSIFWHDIMAIPCWSMWEKGGYFHFCRTQAGACIRWKFCFATLIMDEKLVTFIRWRGCLSRIHYFIMPYCNWRLSYMSQNHYKLKRCKENKVIQQEQDALMRITPQSMNRFYPIVVECVLHASITHKTLESRCHRTTHSQDAHKWRNTTWCLQEGSNPNP